MYAITNLSEEKMKVNITGGGVIVKSSTKMPDNDWWPKTTFYNIFFFSSFCDSLYPHFICRDFITECFKPSPRRPYEIPWEQKAMWAMLFGVMLLIAIIGNCIVIWIVLGNLRIYLLLEYEKLSSMGKGQTHSLCPYRIHIFHVFIFWYSITKFWNRYMPRTILPSQLWLTLKL